MDLELREKRVLVTGASRGIGRAIAEAFLREGARVAICSRSEEAISTAGELRALGEVHAWRVDMADTDAVKGLVADAVAALGGLDIVISNVSAMGGKSFEDTFQVDIAGAQTLIEASLPHMEDHTDANIVCIGSRAGSVGIPWMPAYAAMKAATVSMVKSLAIQVAKRGIRANVVSPGDIKFPGGAWERISEENPKLHDGILRDIPLRRFGRLEEIADVVVFVASRRSSFMTGSNILVDGAATAGLQL